MTILTRAWTAGGERHPRGAGVGDVHAYTGGGGHACLHRLPAARGRGSPSSLRRTGKFK